MRYFFVKILTMERLHFSCIMQLRAENQNLVSALSNYQQILYQFFDFTQNLKQSQGTLQ